MGGLSFEKMSLGNVGSVSIGSSRKLAGWEHSFCVLPFEYRDPSKVISTPVSKRWCV